MSPKFISVYIATAFALHTLHVQMVYIGMGLIE